MQKNEINYKLKIIRFSAIYVTSFKINHLSFNDQKCEDFVYSDSLKECGMKIIPQNCNNINSSHLQKTAGGSI